MPREGATGLLLDENYCETKEELAEYFMKSDETINGEHYGGQLIELKQAIAEKCAEYATRSEAIIFDHETPSLMLQDQGKMIHIRR